jgi:hypothetical protein
MKRVGGVIIMALLFNMAALFGKDKMTKDVKEIVKACAKDPRCSTLVRDIKVRDGQKWNVEPLLILRSAQVPEMRIARFKGEDGAYIVLMIPELSTDMGLVRIFEGK